MWWNHTHRTIFLLHVIKINFQEVSHTGMCWNGSEKQCILAKVLTSASAEQRGKSSRFPQHHNWDPGCRTDHLIDPSVNPAFISCCASVPSEPWAVAGIVATYLATHSNREAMRYGPMPGNPVDSHNSAHNGAQVSSTSYIACCVNW